MAEDDNILRNPKKKTMYEKYAAPTPIKWRKVGDSVLVGTSGMSAVIMGAPFPEHITIWVVFGLNVIGVGGKIVTNFFSED